MDYVVRPLVGIGPFLLGMSRDKAQRIPRDAALQIFFDDQDQIEYLEASGPTSTMAALYKGVDVHRTPATEVVSLISKDAAFDPDDPEHGYSYIFPSLELSVWRPTVPNNSQDPDGRCFRTIGVGRKGYYSQK